MTIVVLTTHRNENCFVKAHNSWFAIAKNESYVVYYSAARLRYSTVTRM